MQRDRSWLGPLAGLMIVALLVWRLGAGTFVDALRHLDVWSVAAGAAIAVLTTVCGAWRWVLVARGLGAELSLRSAVAESYRSQFLNVTLPGGMLGDVHRGVRHGRGGGDLGLGLRSVVWERSAGQVVLAVLTAGVLVLAPGPVSTPFPPGSPAATALAGLARRRRAAHRRPCRPRDPRAPARSATGSYAWCAPRGRTCAPGCWDGIRGRASWGAPRSSWPGTRRPSSWRPGPPGSPRPVTQLLPLALVVLVAMGLPLNVAGWGPREGAAAWAFGAAGLGAAGGVGTAVAYGVMALVASLPGRGRCSSVARRDRRPAGPRRVRRTGPPMADRPYTLLSCSMSIDGYLSAGTATRLLLSNDADFDRVDAERAASDAILVGAATIRQDNPRLLVRSPERRVARVARGLSPSPVKVTVTREAELDCAAAFFAADDADKLVYCPSDAVPGVARSPRCGGHRRRRRASP